MIGSFEENFAALRAKEDAALVVKRKDLRERLLADVLLGEQTPEVEMVYSGYGDSGQIESGPSEEVNEFLWDMMWSLHHGFENNSGGQGTVTWHLLKDEIHVSHEDIIETTELSEDIL